MSYGNMATIIRCLLFIFLVDGHLGSGRLRVERDAGRIRLVRGGQRLRDQLQLRPERGRVGLGALAPLPVRRDLGDGAQHRVALQDPRLPPARLQHGLSRLDHGREFFWP